MKTNEIVRIEKIIQFPLQPHTAQSFSSSCINAYSLNEEGKLQKLSLDKIKTNDLSFLTAFTTLEELYLDDVYVYTFSEQGFGNNFIIAIPFLQHLPKLRVLSLKKNMFSQEHIEILLTNVTQLEVLNVADNRLQNLDFVGKLPYLRELYAGKNSFTNYQDFTLGGLPRLEKLDLSANNLRKLGLFDLPALHKLHLHHNPLQEFSTQNCFYLYQITLQKFYTDFDIAFYDFLATGKLNFRNDYKENFDLSNANILQEANISCSNLKTVNIHDCSQLRTITLTSGEITEITLKNLPNLCEVAVSYTTLQHLCVFNCPKFEKLVITHLEQTEITLSDLPTLRILDISHNYLQNLHLSNCPQLETVILANGKLLDVAFKDLPHVENIDISNSPLQSLTIQNCPQMKKVNIAKTNIRKIDFDDKVALEILDVSHCELCDVPIEWLVNALNKIAQIIQYDPFTKALEESIANTQNEHFFEFTPKTNARIISAKVFTNPKLGQFMLQKQCFEDTDSLMLASVLHQFMGRNCERIYLENTSNVLAYLYQCNIQKLCLDRNYLLQELNTPEQKPEGMHKPEHIFEAMSFFARFMQKKLV